MCLLIPRRTRIYEVPVRVLQAQMFCNVPIQSQGCHFLVAIFLILQKALHGEIQWEICGQDLGVGYQQRIRWHRKY